jgi:hypothetical protein
MKKTLHHSRLCFCNPWVERKAETCGESNLAEPCGFIPSLAFPDATAGQ